MAQSGDSKNDSVEGSEAGPDDSVNGASPDDTKRTDPTPASPSRDNIEDAEVISETPPGGDALDENAVDDVADAGEDRITGSGEDAGPEPDAARAAATEPDGEADPEEVKAEDDAETRGETPPAPTEDPAGAAHDGVGMPGAIASEPPASEPAATNTRSLFEPQPEPAAEARPAAAPVPARSSGGLAVIPLLIGGLVAGLIGVIAARYMDRPDAVEGPTPAENAAALEAQSGELSDLSARLNTMGEEVTSLVERDIAGEIAGATEAATAPLSGALAELGSRLDGLSERIEEVSTRVEAVALRPQAPSVDPGEFDEALEAFRSEVNAAIAEATAEIEEARSEAEQITERAFASEQAAVARAAWGEVQAALEAGEPYAEPLAEAQEKLSAEIPEALGAAAADGIPTLGELQASFPDAARNALDASVRSEMGESAMDRFTAFLRVQSGVRSLAPREGDDPDAVLSRAEAAVMAGDLDTALSEIAALPERGAAALEGWAARARTRRDVLEAAQAVSDTVNSN